MDILQNIMLFLFLEDLGCRTTEYLITFDQFDIQLEENRLQLVCFPSWLLFGTQFGNDHNQKDTLERTVCISQSTHILGKPLAGHLFGDVFHKPHSQISHILLHFLTNRAQSLSLNSSWHKLSKLLIMN